MDLLWMILLVVLVFAKGQNVTEVKGELDGDVSLNCSIRNKDIHWLMEVHNQFRINIGRTWSSDSSYSSADFKSKYLMHENRLVIKNLTAGDSRFYFCGEKIKSNITVVDTFHLISDQQSDDQQCEAPSISIWQRKLVVVSSFCLNALMIPAVTGLMCAYFRMKNCCCRMKDRPRFTADHSETLQNPQYEPIQLPPSRPPSRPPSDRLYSLAEYSC